MIIVVECHKIKVCKGLSFIVRVEALPFEIFLAEQTDGSHRVTCPGCRVDAQAAATRNLQHTLCNSGDVWTQITMDLNHPLREQPRSFAHDKFA